MEVNFIQVGKGFNIYISLRRGNTSYIYMYRLHGDADIPSSDEGTPLIYTWIGYTVM